MTRRLALPTDGKVLTPAELSARREAARLVFERHRQRYEALAKGAPALVLVDGSDETGETFTIGEDMVEIEERHFRRYKKSLQTACYFTLAKD